MEEITTKVCTKCKIEKELSEFNKCSKVKVGLRAQCKNCEKLYCNLNKEKLAKRKKQYYLDNKQHFIKKAKQYAIDNPNYKKEYNKDYWQKIKEKDSKRSKEYRLANNEKIKENKKQYYLLNKESCQEKSKNWYLNNIEKSKEYNRNYRIQNLDKLRPLKVASSNKRRAVKRQASPSWSDSTIINQIYIDCELITEMTGIKHHVDHIIPILGKIVCGLHVENNLQIIPAKENLSKSNKLLEELL